MYISIYIYISIHIYRFLSTYLYKYMYMYIVNVHITRFQNVSFLDLSWHKRATAWLFHVGASQNYCVTNSHRSRRLWTNNTSVLLETQTSHGGRYIGTHMRSLIGASIFYVIQTQTQQMSRTRCPRPSKIVASGVRESYLATGGRHGRRLEEVVELSIWSTLRNKT